MKFDKSHKYNVYSKHSCWIVHGDSYIHITSLCFVAVGNLLNSTEYSEKLHFSIEVPI